MGRDWEGLERGWRGVGEDMQREGRWVSKSGSYEGGGKVGLRKGRTGREGWSGKGVGMVD